MATIERIIEYQEERQRTPQEAIEFMQDEIAQGNVESLLVIYHGKGLMGHIPATVERNFTQAQVLWLLEQFRIQFLLGNLTE